jgi:hypothetical protein
VKRRQKLLRDEQWELIEPLFPKPKRRADGRGRPPASNRACFEGILWILQTGAAWRFLPDEYPSPSTCWRRLQPWQELEEMEQVVPWRKLCALIEPHYPQPGNGRPPIGVERMLRIYFLQQWFNL